MRFTATAYYHVDSRSRREAFALGMCHSASDASANPDPNGVDLVTIYNIGEYSVSPYRVLFKELTDFFQCAVVNASAKPAIADTKLRFIECHSQEEAHFLCGLLNSAPAVLFLYSTAT